MPPPLVKCVTLERFQSVVTVRIIWFPTKYFSQTFNCQLIYIFHRFRLNLTTSKEKYPLQTSFVRVKNEVVTTWIFFHYLFCTSVFRCTSRKVFLIFVIINNWRMKWKYSNYIENDLQITQSRRCQTVFEIKLLYINYWRLNFN